ncbi:MAG TPA: GtrA family protein [Polyangiaceae bacterium]|nr:GtrA family protein [Polyangiaceae bacterium]
MATPSSEPSERDPARGSSASTATTPIAGWGLAAHVGAVALALVGELALAGACLLVNALAVGRSGERLRLVTDPTRSRLRPFLDLGLVAAVIAGQTLAAPRTTIHGTGPWSLAGLSLAVAGARTIASHRTGSAPMARALLAAALLLTPVAASLARIPDSAWAITACSVWAAVHLLSQGRALLMRLDSKGVVRGYGLILSGKGGATRNGLAALTATGVDFVLFSALVAVGCSPPIATLIGAACGGAVNFTVNRTWTFAPSGSNRRMARRYVLVSAASAALNATMVAALLWIPHQHVTICWLVARGLIFLGWNYPLHRDYVFAHGGRAAG